MESCGPDLGSREQRNIRQDLRDVPEMLTLLTGPKDPTVTPLSYFKSARGDGVQKRHIAFVFILTAAVL